VWWFVVRRLMWRCLISRFCGVHLIHIEDQLFNQRFGRNVADPEA